MFRIVFIFIMLIHGLIHLMGFFKAFAWFEVEQLSMDFSKFKGILWLTTTMLFGFATILYLFRKDWWWAIALLAIIISQILVINFWQDAKFGSIANLIILIITIIGFGNWNFDQMVNRDIQSFFAPGNTEYKFRPSESPEIITRWMNYAGVKGNERFNRISVQQKGKMKTSQDGKWIPFTAQQWIRTDHPAFYWQAKVNPESLISFRGRDRLKNGKGEMLIKLQSLIPIVREKGAEIDQGAMVRYLAEIIWHPQAADRQFIKWEQISDSEATATLAFGNQKVSGNFTFDPRGFPISFQASRYYSRPDGATLETWYIEIDQGSYKSFQGIRIPAKSQVTWKLPDGDFTWLEIEILDLQYAE